MAFSFKKQAGEAIACGRGSKAAKTAFAALLASAVALTSLPAAGIAASGSAPVSYDSASITVTRGPQGSAALEADDTVTYAVYQIFKANVDVRDGVDHMKNIVWGDGINADKLCAWLVQQDYVYPKPPTEITNPQEAAIFISESIFNSDASDVTSPYKHVDSHSFADELATWLKENVAPAATVSANDPINLTEGYYLFTAVDGTQGSGDKTINTHEAGSAPIFTTVGGTVQTIQEKVSVPNLTKWVIDDAALPSAGAVGSTTVPNNQLGDSDQVMASYGKAADASKLQPVEFKLDGTLPSNLSSYDYYYYGFSDVVPAGMDVNVDSVRVTCDGNDITGHFRVSYTAQDDGSHLLEVFCNDILSGGGVGAPRSGDNPGEWLPGVVSGGSIVVDYQATLNDQSVLGSKGNWNTAWLTYTNNPTLLSNGDFVRPGENPGNTSQTPKDDCVVFTYRLNVNKIDASTKQPLENFAFTLKNQDGRYINRDGSISTNTSAPQATYNADGSPSAQTLADTRILLTDEQGNASWPRIDEDTYSLSEIAVASAGYGFYDLLDHDVTIDIKSNVAQVAKDHHGTALTLGVTVDGMDAELGVIDDHADDATKAAVDADSGVVNVQTQVQDRLNIPMPITGIELGVVPIVGIGGAVVALCAVVYVVAKRKRDEA